MRCTRCIRTPLGRIGLCLGIIVFSALATREALSMVSRTQHSDMDAIEAALNDYLYGLRDGDVDRLRRAFHPSAEIEGIRDGVFTSWTVGEYVSGIVRGQRRRFVGRILAVDQVGSAAVGKVESDYGTWKFVDFMQLLRVDGQWVIVNKIYQRVVDIEAVR